VVIGGGEVGIGIGDAPIIAGVGSATAGSPDTFIVGSGFTAFTAFTAFTGLMTVGTGTGAGA
jgi:hypothetical protein